MYDIRSHRLYPPGWVGWSFILQRNQIACCDGSVRSLTMSRDYSEASSPSPLPPIYLEAKLIVSVIRLLLI